MFAGADDQAGTSTADQPSAEDVHGFAPPGSRKRRLPIALGESHSNAVSNAQRLQAQSAPGSPTHERQQVEKHCDTRQVQEKYLIAAYMSLEHKALITLCWLVPAYFVGVQLLGFLAISCYIAVGPPEVREVLQRESVNATFYGFFSTIAAFSNAGMTPLDENLISFPDPALLLPMSMLILSGNTMFAPSMRFIIWCLYRCTREKNPQKQVYEYLLMYPRKCFTHLFPQVHTVWLLITVVAFNAIDFVTFRSLDWNSAALKGMRTMDKLMAGLFQSINTRSAGMNVFILHELSAATLLLYAAMMCVYCNFPTRIQLRIDLSALSPIANQKCNLWCALFAGTSQSIQCSSRDRTLGLHQMAQLCIMNQTFAFTGPKAGKRIRCKITSCRCSTGSYSPAILRTFSFAYL